MRLALRSANGIAAGAGTRSVNTDSMAKAAAIRSLIPRLNFLKILLDMHIRFGMGRGNEPEKYTFKQVAYAGVRKEGAPKWRNLSSGACWKKRSARRELPNENNAPC